MERYRAGIDVGSTTVKLALLDQKGRVLYGSYKRHQAHTPETLSSLLKEARQACSRCERGRIR